MDEGQLLERIDRFLAENKEAVIADAAKVVAVPSVEAPPAGDKKPYGEAAAEALAAALGIARGFGLEVNDGGGHMGWAELPGREEGHIATVSHLDVVPAGEGWSGDPFVLARRDGWLIGRGIIDNKGPSVLCLYLAKFYKQLAEETGAPLRYGLRVLLGCNEESGMRDVAYYLARQPQPLFAFSPDADFPVCNGEKGHYLGWFSSGPLSGAKLLELDVGLAVNVIPAKASCLVKGDAGRLAGTERIRVSAEAGAVRIEASGVGGHASRPEGTLNAIGLLVDYLLDNALCTESENSFLRLVQKLHRNNYGEGLGIACSDEAFGPLTTNGGMIRLRDGRLWQSLDSRYPAAADAAVMKAKLNEAAAAHGAEFTESTVDKPFYIPAENPAIAALTESCNQVFGRDEKPFTMGGGTYARHFKNAVSYGPTLHDRALPPFAGAEHAPNEALSIEEMMNALKAFILALWRLQTVDF